MSHGNIRRIPRSCVSYHPGHRMHWIHAKKAHVPQPQFTVVVTVHDDGHVELDDDDLHLSLWHHDPAWLESVLMTSPPMRPNTARTSLRGEMTLPDDGLTPSWPRKSSYAKNLVTTYSVGLLIPASMNAHHGTPIRGGQARLDCPRLNKDEV